MPVWLVYFGLTIILAILFFFNQSQGAHISTRATSAIDPVFRISVLLLVAVAGFRLIDVNYSDEWNYRASYEALAASSLELPKTEILFRLLNYVLSRISDNSQMLIFACAAITNVLIGYAIYRNTQSWKLAILLYLLMGYYFASWNIVRQFLAIAILSSGLPHLFSRNWKIFLFYVVFAAGFHNSVLMMAPVYFLLARRAWTRLSLIYALSALGVFVYASSVLPFIFESSGYSRYYLDLLFSEESYGVKGLRVAVWCVPAGVSFFFQNRIRELDAKRAEIFMNAALLSALIMIVSLKFVYVARMEYHFSVFIVSLVSLFPRMFHGGERRLATMLILVCYSIFCWFLVADFPFPFEWRLALF